MADRKFKNVSIGEIFRFTSERDFKYSGMAKGPWVKISARTYKHVDGGPTHRVGSVSATVLNERSNPPRRRLNLGQIQRLTKRQLKKHLRSGRQPSKRFAAKLRTYRITAEIGRRPKKTRSHFRGRFSQWKVVAKPKFKIKAASLRGAIRKAYTRMRRKYNRSGSKRVSIHVDSKISKKKMKAWMSGKIKRI